MLRRRFIPCPRFGFTILEVLIAVILVGVSMFAMMQVMHRSFFGLGDIEDVSLGLSLTQERMESIQDTAFGSVASSAKATVTGFSDFDQAVTVTSPHSLLKQVVVTTYWQTPGGEQNMSLTTYVVNN